MAYIISADEIKKTFAGYNPERTEEFHTQSAKQADQHYAAALKTRTEPTVILMAGGAASGKSEYVSAYLTDKEVIVFDGTLPTLHGAKIKTGRAKKAGKHIEIHVVLPESLRVAFVAFLNRDRKFADEHFYRTHSNARQTVLEIARQMPEIVVRIFMSTVQIKGKEPSMTFRELELTDNKALIEFLKANQYTEEAIRKLVVHP